jgi:hypothetical protein
MNIRVMPSVKTCAVVQGNIRRGTDEVLKCLVQHFDLVILSTWEDELPENIPFGTWELVTSRKPAEHGNSHRNFQRLSSAAGLRRAEELGATHVLKWRTDMLPTKMDVSQLLAWSAFEVPDGMASRLVTCAFRNLTVRQDWFSTIPDLFAFADIGLMRLLWGDESFDYMQNMNIPVEMVREYGLEWATGSDAVGSYCAEAELYAIFKNRLQRERRVHLTHSQIAKDYMRLFDHQRLGICWFGSDGAFRSISQALQHPWWTERTWEFGEPKVSELGYPETTLMQKLRRKHLTRWVSKSELRFQRVWLEEYRRNSD